MIAIYDVYPQMHADLLRRMAFNSNILMMRFLDQRKSNNSQEIRTANLMSV